MRPFYRFGLVGLVGFCIDFLIFKLLFALLPTALEARVLSWLFAVLFTYCGNSVITFSQPSFSISHFPGDSHLRVALSAMVVALREVGRVLRKPFSQFLLYISFQFLGGTVNIAVFGFFYFILFGGHNQFAAFMAGTFAGLGVNYFGAKLSIGSS